MDSVPIIDDFDIRQRVESLVGKNTRILDCEKKSSLVTEEVLMINGQPVKLVGEAGERIKRALKAGEPPPPEILAQILQRAGIESGGVEVETTMTMKSNTKTSELSTLKDRDGKLLDEKLKEFEEDDEFESTNVEMWEKEPQELRDQLEREKNRMWDYYKGVEPLLTRKKGPKSSPTSDKPSNKSSFSFESRDQSSSPEPDEPPTWNPSQQQQQQKQKVTVEQKQEEHNKSTSFSSSTYPQSTASSDGPILTRSPGKMPPLSRPSNPKIRPLIPPKPQWKEPYVGALRREKNFQLPVRVVYETFI